MSSAASSSAPPPLPDVDMTPATSTASASPHTLPAILYVQVEGEPAIGDVELQPGDSVKSVVKRTVKDRDIEFIEWKDVAGWKLQRSDGSFVKEDGRRSEPLLKLLPFPDESLLVLTRRPIPPTISSSSSSSSASSLSSSSSSLPSSTSYMLMPMWRPWNQSSEDEPTLQQTAVHSLEELRAHVSRTLGVGWEDPGFYVYPDPDRRVEDRVRVDSDGLLRDWCGARVIFYAYPRTSKARTPPKDKSGLPLSIRTKRDREEAAELAAMVAARYAPPSSTSAESSTHNSPPRPTASSTTPPGLPKSPSPPTAARVLSTSSPSSPSSGNSPSSGDGCRTPGSQQADMRQVVLERDSSRCVFTDRVLPPDNPLSMPVAHILPAEPSERLLHRDFVLWFETTQSDKYAKYREYIVPRVNKGSKRARDADLYPYMLQLPYPAYDSRLGLLADLYFNAALEKGWVEFEVAQDDTVTFSLPVGASVQNCRAPRTLRSPLQDFQSNPPTPQLSDTQRQRLYEWWPRRFLFELYRDVWCSYCRWRESMGRVKGTS